MRVLIKVVGIGPGNIEDMTQRAKDAINEADCIIGGQRQLEVFKDIRVEKISLAMGFKEIILEIKKRCETQNIVVIVSGDPCYYSLFRYLNKNLSCKLEVVAGLNSIQYFFSKIGKTYEEAIFLSVHGRECDYIDAIRDYKMVALLTDYQQSPQAIAKKLKDLDMAVKMYVGYRLSYDDEKIIEGMPKDILDLEHRAMAVVLLERLEDYNRNCHIADIDFVRNKTPMTKEEIRYITLGKLELRSNHHLVDIGSGTGSVSIEASRFLYKGRVTSIEVKDEAVSIMKENIKKHRCENIELIHDDAIDALEKIESCDRVFIGGTRGNFEKIMNLLEKKLPSDGIVVMNAVTLETLSKWIEYLNATNKRYELIQIQISRSTKLGNYQMLDGNRPIFMMKIWWN